MECHGSDSSKQCWGSEEGDPVPIFRKVSAVGTGEEGMGASSGSGGEKQEQNHDIILIREK